MSLRNSQPYKNWTTWRFIRRYRWPIIRKLKTMVKRRKDQKLRLRNFDGKIETGAVVKNRKGLIGVEAGKGFCYQWKEKSPCSEGDQCSFRHDGDERATPTPKTFPSSEPPTQRGRSASRKRSLRGRSPSGRTNRQPYLVTVGILPFVKFISRNRVVNSATVMHKNRHRMPPHLLSHQ